MKISADTIIYLTLYYILSYLSVNWPSAALQRHSIGGGIRLPAISRLKLDYIVIIIAYVIIVFVIM